MTRRSIPSVVPAFSLCLILIAAFTGSPAWGQDVPGNATEGPPEGVTTVVAGYRNGFFIGSEDGSFLLRINGRVQSRVRYDEILADTKEYQFFIPRARLEFAGNAYTENLEYKISVDFGGGFVVLKDAVIDYGFVPEKLILRVGQSKRPFSRQFITSSAKQQFVERSFTSAFFGRGRDIGLLIQNDYKSSPTLEYALGMFNGTGEFSRFSIIDGVDTTNVEEVPVAALINNVPDQFRPQVVARLGYNHGGIKGYSEGDLSGGPLRFAIAASSIYNFDSGRTTLKGWRGQGDFVLKYRHLSVTGEFYAQSLEGRDILREFDGDETGYLLQAGYLFGGLFEPALRYARATPEDAENDIESLAGAASFYFYGHKFKWQTDYTVSDRERVGDDETEHRLRSQLQLAF
jgi:phosphate-selective porin OprO/OprP